MFEILECAFEIKVQIIKADGGILMMAIIWRGKQKMLCESHDYFLIGKAFSFGAYNKAFNKNRRAVKCLFIEFISIKMFSNIK